MNKWWWLLLVISCWMVIGATIFNSRQDQDNGGAPPPVKFDRIVSLAPNLTEILFAIGLDDEIVGVTLDSDYPPEATAKPKVGTFWQPNIEAVVAARPNLVITLGFQQQKDLAERLRRIGYNNLTVNIEKVGDLFLAIDKIGIATNKQQQADELISLIKTKLKQLATLVSNEAKVRVLWVVQREPLRVAGRDTFVNEMIELAGGENAIGQTVHKYPPIGSEQVIACDADVIIESMDSDDIKGQRDRALQYWSKYQYLPAVASNRVYVIDGDTVSRLGPRLHEGMETIARCLRPELFKTIEK
ncbi:MAG: ABC transporter substrate-binding protein [Sedimentisphaerales bacterium]|nr:ABC transporter substrate-binding protein [Sedimentisphaerales bacterium]